MRETIPNPESAKLEFFRMIPSAPQPIAADGSAAGTLPVRAFRYCEPIRLASSIGWYVFPPIDFSVVWNGVTIEWKCEGFNQWLPLSAAQFPCFAKYFDSRCPEGIKGYSPPFISSVMNSGIFQLWSGLIARTSENWFLNVRPPINLPSTRHAHSFEGIIETDKWFGPLFTNFQITKTDVEIKFSRTEPMFLVHLIHRSMLPRANSQSFEFSDLEEFSDADWDGYRRTIVDRVGEKRVIGSYATASRKIRKAQSAPVQP